MLLPNKDYILILNKKEFMKIYNILAATIIVIPVLSNAGPLTVLASKEAVIVELAKAKKMNLAEEAERIAANANKVGKLPHEDLIAVPKYKLDAEVSQSSEFSAAFQKTLADSIHADWQKTALASGKTERFKALKVNGKTINSQKDLDQYFAANNIPEEFKKYFRIKDGQVEEDILHIPNRYLGPNNKAENDASAKVVAVLFSEYIKRGGKTDPESLRVFMQKASDIVHQQWMLRNSSWAPENQMQPFARLSPEEAQKDVDMVALGFSDYAKAQEEFLTGQIKKMDDSIKELNAKGNTHQADSVEKTRKAYQSKLEVLKTQNRMLQYKPAAGPAAAPAAATR